MTDRPRPGADRSVRPALADDASDIGRIQAAALAALAPGLPGADPASLAAAWTTSLTGSRPPGVHALVALHGTAVVGYALAAPGERIDIAGRDPIPAGADIHELAVDPDFARSGHGSRLLHAIADTTGAACLRVWVGADDQARIRFYQGAGFAPAGLRCRLTAPGARADDLVQHLWWAAL
ncbi:GNAT family N-acetyltransferase [Actinomyces sp. B33]|uniref:GNAT family N-acetyltransferase n=1 Tax=Actinomyces sp. B33 TaxID=2942131 RepID=UPI002340A474|nr:GNAT family N-acetyltransferase [Actinomyces sp. B33]MDC4233031.1 GNAT family N-acetyltransferase [Actinomyces sp. B33]